MIRLICWLAGHKVRFGSENKIFVGYCRRCERTIYEKRRAREFGNPGKNKGRRKNDGFMGAIGQRRRSGEVVVGFLALAILLGAAIADGVKSEEKAKKEETEEIYGTSNSGKVL